MLCEVKGWGDVLVLLSILRLRTCYWGSGVRPFQHPCTPPSLAANHCLASVVALGKERVSCPAFIGTGSWAQGNPGLVAFASALPPEADLCLVTVAGRREFPTPSPQGQARFVSILALGARRFAAPLPAAEGCASSGGVWWVLGGPAQNCLQLSADPVVSGAPD